MSATKHTPGPWSFRKDRDNGDDYVIYSERAMFVAQAWGGMPSGVTEANARLIAAAPELLAELRNALSFIDEAVAAGALDAIEVQQQFEAARTLLAKVEGR